MQAYGSADYWNERYKRSAADAPFDWLFSYDDLAKLLDELIPTKNYRILMIGAGDAPFSSDMYYRGGFTNICNIDISNVAIENQKARYPEQEWFIMDVRTMQFRDEEFPLIIDKSLIDTLACYENSMIEIGRMMDELYRVLKPGGRMISLSLHDLDIAKHYRAQNWIVKSFRIKSARWDATDKGRKRACAQTLIICDKPLDNLNGTASLFLPITSGSQLTGILTEEEYESLSRYAKEVNVRAALHRASIDDLLSLLLKVLVESPAVQTVNSKVN